MQGKIDVRLLPQAEADFIEIIELIAENNLIAAEKMTQRFETAFDNLSLNPMLGSVVRESRLKILGYRHLVILPYIIFYRIRNEKILIHRILHGARNYLAILK